MSPWSALAAQLAGQIPCGYTAAGPACTEPTAAAALALCAYDSARYRRAINRARNWLADGQQTNGSVGPNYQHDEPGWPTSWGLLLEASNSAKQLVHEWLEQPVAPASILVEQPDPPIQSVNPGQPSRPTKPFSVTAALDWITATRGMQMPLQPGVAHNVELVGWSWVTGTHTWLEPTCLAVLALKAHGLGDHARCREGVTVLFDRILPNGGANYGNTIVLGQELRAHIQPTGLLLLALSDEPDREGKRDKSAAWLQAELGTETAAASLSFGLLGLATLSIRPRYALDWLEQAAKRIAERDQSPYRNALLLWTAAVMQSPNYSIWPGRAGGMR